MTYDWRKNLNLTATPALFACALQILMPRPLPASVTIGVNGGVGAFNNGIGANPVFGIEALDPIYQPLLTGFYANYSLLGNATQGSTSVNASLLSFGVKLEYPLSRLVRGLAVAVMVGGAYETVPVNAGGTLVAGSTFVFGLAPELAYDYNFSPSVSAGLAADFDYYTAPSISGVAGAALIAPEILLRLRFAFGQAKEAETKQPSEARPSAMPTPPLAPKVKSKTRVPKPSATPASQPSVSP